MHLLIVHHIAKDGFEIITLWLDHDTGKHFRTTTNAGTSPDINVFVFGDIQQATKFVEGNR